MPAVITCKDRRCEQHWNVGSDDFVVPGIIAIVVGFFNLNIVSAVLIALYYVPSTIYLQDFCDFAYSPLLYAPLFSLAAVEVCFILNEGLIVIVSAQGPIYKQTKSLKFRNKFMPHLIYLRIVVAVLELLAIIASLIGVFLPSSVSDVKRCEPLLPRLYFAQATVLFQVLCYILFLLKVCVYTDPLGCSTPGLLERLSLLDSADGRGSLLLAPSEEAFTDVEEKASAMRRNISIDPSSAAKEINIWTKRNRPIHFISGNDIERATKVHNDSINRQKYERRLRALFCCLGVRGQKSRGVALEDVARGLYTVFSETDIVLSDVIAGFSLLREHQLHLKKTSGGSDEALIKKFRIVTFQMMPPQQRFGFKPGVLRKDHRFDFTNVHNQLLFLDLEHYMHYAMGVYGWPLHIFDNLCCGVCQLCSVTCCRFRCLHKRATKEEFVHDNCCMCGVGTFRLQTNLKERDILYVNFQNKIYLAPFIVCLDHDMKAVVICIRGTLSLKDTLTDMSFSPIRKRIDGVKETYIHGGMYRAALGILNIIRRRDILTRAFHEFPDYQLVLTGHSLGAGVASILALLIKQEMKYSDEVMKCYAFSPPGALFSFPLAEYSKSFITSVVLGNDIVPRLTLRSLLYLKYSVKHLLDHSEVPKFQILCKSRICATLCTYLGSIRPHREEGVNIEEDGVAREKSGRVAGVKSQQGILKVGSGRVAGVSGGVMLEDVVLNMEGQSGGVAGPRVVVTTDDTDVERDEDSVEWKVFNNDVPTTASIRHRLFERSISVQPDNLPQPHSGLHKLARFMSVGPGPSTITHSLASQIKQAVSMNLGDGEVFEGLIQGTEDSTPHAQTPNAARVRIQVDGEDAHSRRGSAPTPGGVIDRALPDIHEHCRIDETSTFMPFFLPGRLLHLQVQKSNRWCGKDHFDVVEVNRENMCIIFLDSGVVDDHLPTSVLDSLKKVKAQCMNTINTYSKQEIQDIRTQQAEFRLGIHKARENSSKEDKQFIFMGKDRLKRISECTESTVYEPASNVLQGHEGASFMTCDDGGYRRFGSFMTCDDGSSTIDDSRARRTTGSFMTCDDSTRAGLRLDLNSQEGRKTRRASNLKLPGDSSKVDKPSETITPL